jgi:hypothetical protein
MKTSIINGSEVSRLSVAIQTVILEKPGMRKGLHAGEQVSMTGLSIVMLPEYTG